MNVYLVPASATRYALYSEVSSAVDDVTDADGAPDSLLGRLKASFRRAVDEGEAAQDEPGQDDPSRGKFRRFITRKLAEAVAEQRLLWHLRHEAAAHLLHPDRLSGDDAMKVVRVELEADYGRHRRWLVIDGLITAITGPLFFFVPGPNVVSWYFLFRAIGHFLSMRGASRALSLVEWTPEATEHLTAVGDALLLDKDLRAIRVASAAAALGLDRLPAFVERVADRLA